MLVPTALATVLPVLRIHDVLGSNESPADLGQTSAVLDVRKDDLDQTKGTAGSFFGPLVHLLDVRRAKADDKNLFADLLEVLPDGLPPLSTVLAERREDLEESAHDVKKFRDDLKESSQDLKESSQDLKDSLQDLKDSLQDLKDSVQ